MKKSIFIGYVLAAFILSACTIRLGDFTAISTKNVPIEYKAAQRSEGKDCVGNFLGIPFGFPNLQEAVDDAIGSKGNALVNQVTYSSGWTVILFGQQCLKVKGEVVTLD